MELFLDYLYVFLIGGLICMLGQVLIITTKITSARILVLFVLIGVFLEAATLFSPMAEFAKAGVKVPIIGFGAGLARGAIEGVKSFGLIGVFSGGVAATAGGIAAAVLFAFIFSFIFKAKTK